MDHAARGLQESGLADVMAGFLLLNRPLDERCHLRIAAPTLHHAVQITVGLRKEACSDLAIRCQPHTATVAAEGLGYGCDDPNFADAIIEGVANGSLTGCMRWQLYQWPKGLESRLHFLKRKDRVRRLKAALFKWHEFDESDYDAFLAGKLREGNDLVVVETA